MVNVIFSRNQQDSYQNDAENDSDEVYADLSYEEKYCSIASFKEIKDVEVPKITDALIEIEDCFNEKKYKELNEANKQIEELVHLLDLMIMK